MHCSQVYPEGSHTPERGGGCNWWVWCRTGTLQVLAGAEYKTWLAEHPNATYIISFANGSYARIQPGHPLWNALAEVAGEYSVEVLPPGFDLKFLPWLGTPESPQGFDCIKISVKKTCE